MLGLSIVSPQEFVVKCFTRRQRPTPRRVAGAKHASPLRVRLDEGRGGCFTGAGGGASPGGSPPASTSTHVWPRLKATSLPAASKKRVRENVSGLDQVPGTATLSWKTTASPPPTVSYSRWAVPSPAERALGTMTAAFLALGWRPGPPSLGGAPPWLAR